MSTAGRSLLKQAKSISRKTGRDEGEVLDQLIYNFTVATRQRGIAGIFGIILLALSFLAVLFFVPPKLIDKDHFKVFAVVGGVALLANLLIGIGAFHLKTVLGHRWGYAEIGGALLASIALAVQIFYGTKTDYGIWLLAELAIIFGTVKGFDTIEKGEKTPPADIEQA